MPGLVFFIYRFRAWFSRRIPRYEAMAWYGGSIPQIEFSSPDIFQGFKARPWLSGLFKYMKPELDFHALCLSMDPGLRSPVRFQPTYLGRQGLGMYPGIGSLGIF
jgi:hypothetical protein